MTDTNVYGYALEGVQVLGGAVLKIAAVLICCTWAAVMLLRAGS